MMIIKNFIKNRKRKAIVMMLSFLFLICFSGLFSFHCYCKNEPLTVNIDAQTDFAAKVEQCAQLLPKTTKKAIRNRNITIYACSSQKVMQMGGKGVACTVTNHKDGHAEIYISNAYEDTYEVVRHEVGHGMDQALSPSWPQVCSDRPGWRSVLDTAKDMEMERFGSFSYIEAFADCYNLYLSEPEYLMQKAPLMYTMLDIVLN